MDTNIPNLLFKLIKQDSPTNMHNSIIMKRRAINFGGVVDDM